MRKIKLNAFVQGLAKNGTESVTLITGYPVSQSGGQIQIALDVMGARIVAIPEADLLHHTDGESDAAPSSFVVKGDAQVVLTTKYRAIDFSTVVDSEGSQDCGCDCGGSSEDTIARQKGQSRTDAIRNARCLGAYIGCSASCSLDKYPDLCRSICRNQYTRCTTPLVYY
jgi:hypothetical protein